MLVSEKLIQIYLQPIGESWYVVRKHLIINKQIVVFLFFLVFSFPTGKYAQNDSCVDPPLPDSSYLPGLLELGLKTESQYFPVFDSLVTAAAKKKKETGIAKLDSINFEFGIVSINIHPSYYEIDSSGEIRYEHRESRKTMIINIQYHEYADIFSIAENYCQFPFVKWATQAAIHNMPTSLIQFSWANVKKGENK